MSFAWNWIASWWSNPANSDTTPVLDGIECQVFPGLPNMDSNILVSGPAGCGKTTLILNLYPRSLRVQPNDITTRSIKGLETRHFQVDLCNSIPKALMGVLINNRQLQVCLAFSASTTQIIQPSARANIDWFFAFDYEPSLCSYLNQPEDKLQTLFSTLEKYECICWRYGDSTIYKFKVGKNYS